MALSAHAPRSDPAVPLGTPNGPAYLAGKQAAVAAAVEAGFHPSTFTEIPVQWGEQVSVSPGGCQAARVEWGGGSVDRAGLGADHGSSFATSCSLRLPPPSFDPFLR